MVADAITAADARHLNVCCSRSAKIASGLTGNSMAEKIFILAIPAADLPLMESNFGGLRRRYWVFEFVETDQF